MEHLEDLDINGKITLNWIFKRWNGRMWSGFAWLRVGL
jgi:hypothetical protein